MPTQPNQTGPSVPAGEAEKRVADSLTSGMLLAFVGGSLDAFLYLNHGHVFAGAMTGNAVLCGIALLSGNKGNAVHHV